MWISAELNLSGTLDYFNFAYIQAALVSWGIWTHQAWITQIKRMEWDAVLTRLDTLLHTVQKWYRNRYTMHHHFHLAVLTSSVVAPLFLLLSMRAHLSWPCEEIALQLALCWFLWKQCKHFNQTLKKEKHKKQAINSLAAEPCWCAYDHGKVVWTGITWWDLCCFAGNFLQHACGWCWVTDLVCTFLVPK